MRPNGCINRVYTMKMLNDRILDAIHTGLPTGDLRVVAFCTRYDMEQVGILVGDTHSVPFRALFVIVECWHRATGAVFLYHCRCAYQRRDVPRGGAWLCYHVRMVLRQPIERSRYLATDTLAGVRIYCEDEVNTWAQALVKSR